MQTRMGRNAWANYYQFRAQQARATIARNRRGAPSWCSRLSLRVNLCALGVCGPPLCALCTARTLLKKYVCCHLSLHYVAYCMACAERPSMPPATQQEFLTTCCLLMSIPMTIRFSSGLIAQLDCGMRAGLPAAAAASWPAT